jgi:hypothetical protein
MALLWCEGFDHYGGDKDKLAEGPWAQVDTSFSEFTLDQTIVRTGNNSLKHEQIENGVAKVARRVLGGEKTGMGVGCAVYYDALPSQNDESVIVDFRDAGNRPLISIVCNSTGTLQVTRGDGVDGTVLGTTATPVIVAQAFQHIEVQVVVSATVGAVEVRVNGITRIALSSINTIASASELNDFSTNGETNVAQVAFCGGCNTFSLNNLGNINVYWDDVYAYDFLGAYNNTWLGDRRVYTLYPNNDTAQADWTVVGAPNPYEAIDSPLNDSTYIRAPLPGSPDELRSDFELDPLPQSTGLVAGIMLTQRARKNEAGAADIKSGIISDGIEAEGVVHPINPVFTYHDDVFQFDPATGGAFTTDAINALKVKTSRIS